MGSEGGRESRNNEVSLAKDSGIIEGGVDHGTGGAISKTTGVEKDRDHFLFDRSCVFLPVTERVGLFFAAGIGACGGDRPAKSLNE